MLIMHLMFQYVACLIVLLSTCRAFSFLPSSTRSAAVRSSRKSSLSATRVNFDNFWIETFANFTACDDPPDRDPDFVSRSGSKYWNVDDAAVIRQSDHWTGQHGCRRIVDCLWWIDREFDFEETVTGKCDFENFAKKKRKGRRTLRERGVVVKEKAEKLELVQIKIDFDNFWRSTQAKFEACDYPRDREPEFSSKSGSVYWDDGDGVIRRSDHWTGQFGVTQIVDCRWTIDVPQRHVKEPISGKCLYENFALRRKKRKAVSWRKLSR